MVFIITVGKGVCGQLRTLELCKKALCNVNSPEGKSNIKSIATSPVTCLKSDHQDIWIVDKTEYYEEGRT